LQAPPDGYEAGAGSAFEGFEPSEINIAIDNDNVVVMKRRRNSRAIRLRPAMTRSAEQIVSYFEW